MDNFAYELLLAVAAEAVLEVVVVSVVDVKIETNGLGGFIAKFFRSER